MGQAILRWAILIIVLVGVPTGLRPGQVWGEEPEIVARVNGEPVTRGEVLRVLADRAMRRRMKEELGVKEPGSRELERLAVQKLVSRRLILQEAARRQFTVTELELKRAFTAFRRRFKDSRKFAVWMRERGLDENSLREALRMERLMIRVRAALVEGVRVTGDLAREYYEAHRDDLKIAEEVRLRIIGVEDNVAAEEILTTLKEGEDFSRLARERSLESRAAQGGDMGWVGPQTLPPPLQEAVGTLKAGETGGPVQIDDGLLIVRLEERRPARTKTLAEARPEIEARLLRTNREEVFQAWLREQEAKSKIEVFLQPGSADEQAMTPPDQAMALEEREE
ncbi:MAG TPA: peptidyl-prolyl cis-trans isomerase [Candidatus Methylomirabilis sp.]|nr:peptidyl-prolyl cis-trans isomerase [Candidatus Methylomirabilis sp.]HSB82844.1 peptidyl-prolyl cis-trans isomerase [Candidatus Methylomirabilis sp.]